MSWTIHRKKFLEEIDAWGNTEEHEHVLAFNGHGQVLVWVSQQLGLEREELEKREHVTLSNEGLSALFDLLEAE